MPQEYPVIRAADLAEGDCRVVQVGNREIGIFNIRGQYYALSNMCCHQSGPLCRGPVSGTVRSTPESGMDWILEGEVVTCPWHSMEFHIPSGQSLVFPNERVATYQCRVDDGVVKVIL